MAPAGTVYRSPVDSANSDRKRRFSNISSEDELAEVIAIEDSSDDEAPARGDIRPSTFKRPSPRPAALDKAASKGPPVKRLNSGKLNQLAQKVMDLLRKRGRDHSPEACKAALEAHDYSVGSAVQYLLRRSKAATPAVDEEEGAKSFIRSFANGSTAASATNSPSSDSPDPQPKKRKLVRGVRRRSPSSSQPVPASEATDVGGKPKAERAVVSLLSDDEADDGEYSRPSSSASQSEDGDDIDHRTLKYLNTCTVDDLVSILGGKAKPNAETLVAHRPFRTVAAVDKVKRSGKGRSSRRDIGTDIFASVTEYLEALDAIDIIVKICDREGSRIKSTVQNWNINARGEKEAEQAKDGHPMTPSGSNDNELVRLPIPQEPAYMRGHCTMKGYQLYGLNWMWQLYKLKFGCILADDMGLGKTCQVVAFLCHLVESYNPASRQDRPWPNLVVVPPTTLGNWKNEFKKFAPELQVTIYDGSQAEREEIASEIEDDPSSHHVILASYSKLTAKPDIDNMRRLEPTTAIFDEGHKMKNSATNVYKGLLRIKATWRLILSGTPVQNHLMEMINLLNFIQPALFQRHMDKLAALFSQRFTLQDVSKGALLFSDRVLRARSILEPFILQRRKEQVLADLPKKTVRVLSCPLDSAQKPIYEAYEKRFKRGKAAAEGGRSSQTATTRLVDDQNNVWIQLRKAAIHAQLFRRHFKDDTVAKMGQTLMKYIGASELRQPNLSHLINELKDCNDLELHTWCKDYKCLAEFDTPAGATMRSGKVVEFLKLIKHYQANGDRALVFSKFAKVVNILRECLAEEGIPYLALEGQTRVDERQELIEEFNRNPDIPVFLLTTGSGGSGINLTAANKIIIFDQSDNPQDDVQAENRAHRLGQTRDVEVVKLITEGTIEELVYTACQQKLKLADKVTGVTVDDEAEQSRDMEKIVRKLLLDRDLVTPPKSEKSAADQSDFSGSEYGE